MKRIISSLAILIISFQISSAQTRIKKNSNDFVPGDKVIFLDSLKYEQLGEFPSKWDLTYGSVEIMEMDGQSVIGFVQSGSTIIPLMDEKSYLPEIFTIELDIYFHNMGNEAYTVGFDNRKMNVNARIDGIKYSGPLLRSPELKPEQGWRHLSISFNKRAYKVYLDGKRLVNIPNIKTPPKSFSISALSHNSAKDRYALAKNIRLAEGGVPLYKRLMTDGKFVTSDILFETNKATLKPESMSTIKQVIDLMEKHPELKLSIEGHTDSDGTDAYNQKLSEERAAAVKQAITERGIEGSRLGVKGFGESKPLDQSNTEIAKAKNRRVEFVLLK